MARTTPDASGSDTPQPSDADLMAQLARGRMEALETLVRRHQDRVRATAYRLTGHWDVADDIAQDTFLRLHRSAASYEPTAALSTWLYRICVNLCLDRQRRQARAPVALVVDPGGEPPAEEELIRSERIAAIREQVMKLPERQRVAIVLHRFEGLSHAEISQVTGWSASSVESLLVRAYENLRSRLKTWVVSA